jgi:putative hydrolase of the HAD superfamily
MITFLTSVHNIPQVKAILFDVNGTLREREAHPETQDEARAFIKSILGKESVTESFWGDLEEHYKQYGLWAQDKLIQLTEAEIWTRWMLPDEPAEIVAPNAPDLMLAWSRRKGRVLPKPDTEAVLRELTTRGYKLGLISNTMSTLDIPAFIEASGWSKYLGVVVLSAFERVRKPAPDPFLKAANAFDLAPRDCAYVGNKFTKDIVGCKRAGFALGVLLRNSRNPVVDDNADGYSHDLVVDSLTDLLTVFSLHPDTPQPEASSNR